MPIIHWFRRDLRLSDNSALDAALHASAGNIASVFILDDRLLQGRDIAPARVQFLLDCLRQLDASLRAKGAALIVRRGDPAQVLPALVRETNASAVYFNRDYTPLAQWRDARVMHSLEGIGCKVLSFKDAVIHAEDEVLNKAGTPYTLFTPYKRAWLELPKLGPLRAAPWPGVSEDVKRLATQTAIPTLAELGFSLSAEVNAALPPGGERAAQARLDEFTARALDTYHQQRDTPAVDGTSRLSPYLRMGALSPRACLRAAWNWRDENERTPTSHDARAILRPSSQLASGADAWINQLIWRDFYTQILHHFPHVDHASYRPIYDRLRWGSSDAGVDAARFTAWCEGRTGYPIIDAAMRQMNQAAWMHNRTRMLAASFLVKDLLLDWRMGESYFMRRLVDGDAALNNAGWQWVASTGPDPQPYFRIFNPLLQGKRYDPDGDYVRRYVPELARVPDRYIHAPWRMSLAAQEQAGCIIGLHYPAPIVDHTTQKNESIRRFKEIRHAR
jgi:deoxyribodipyrimidine photo-lyase